MNTQINKRLVVKMNKKSLTGWNIFLTICVRNVSIIFCDNILLM